MILMNDFKAEPLELKRTMKAAANRVIDSGWYVLGSELAEFEAQWAQKCGVPFGVGLGNGMDAIEIALRCLGVGPGDEVITTSMTAFATVLAVLRAGATPVLADIDAKTGLMCVKSVERCLSLRTKAIVLVHLYGQIRAMSEWQALCNLQGIHLIEDCAQAHLASWQGKTAGSFGDAGAYSFYPTKNLGAPGDAGMLVTHNGILAEQASRLRNYGQSTRYHHPEIGMNSRLDEIQAAILNERMKWLGKFTNRRRQIAQMYSENLSTSLIQQLLPPEECDAHVYHLYVIICRNRDKLHNYLQQRGIQALIHYPVPIHKQETGRHLTTDPHGLTHSERHAKECLSIPCHPQMSDEQVNYVIEVINSFVEE